MKKGCMILAIVAGLLGFMGGGCTFLASGCVGASKAMEAPSKGKTQKDISNEAAELTTTTMGMSVASILLSLGGLVFGVVAGVVKGRTPGLIFGVLTLAAGGGMLITANFLSGPIMGIAGLLGIIGAVQTKDQA